MPGNNTDNSYTEFVKDIVNNIFRYYGADGEFEISTIMAKEMMLEVASEVERATY